jgi:ferritin
LPAERFVDALNEQITEEFSASQQYLAIAVYYQDQTLPRLAGFFYEQAVEERNHALMMIRYLVDTRAAVKLSDIPAPRLDFGDFVEPIKLALEQEQSVSGRISEIFGLARDEGDFLPEQFMQWFLKEQVEEEATMSELLDAAERSRELPMQVEEYLARERLGDESADPTAPPVAGA